MYSQQTSFCFAPSWGWDEWKLVFILRINLQGKGAGWQLVFVCVSVPPPQSHGVSEGGASCVLSSRALQDCPGGTVGMLSANNSALHFSSTFSACLQARSHLCLWEAAVSPISLVGRWKHGR